MSEASGDAGADAGGAEPVSPEAPRTEPGESASPPAPEEPRLFSDAPPGLSLPAGLPPSPGILPPEITLPPGFTLGQDPLRATQPTDGSFAAPHEGGFTSVFETPSVQAQATQQEQREAQAQHQAQAQAQQAQAAQHAQAQQPPQQPQQPLEPRQQAQQAPQSVQPSPQAPAASPSTTIGGAPSKGSGLSRGAIIGIVGAGVLAVVLFLLVFVAPSLAGDGSDAEPSPDAAQTATAEDAVELFLTALADGDADTAVRLAGADASDPLLIDDVLARSRSLAPITVTAVKTITPDEPTRAVVNATFRLGDRSVNRDFTVWRTDDEWILSDALVALPLSAFDELDPSVNGVPPGSDQPLVFPGAYEIELGVDSFDLAVEGEPLDVLSVAVSEDAAPLHTAEPALTEARTEEFRRLVRASLEECLAMPALSTPCGLDVSAPLDDGAIPIEGSAQRALAAEGERALDELTPSPDYADPARVTTYDYIYISTRIEADRGGELISGTLYSSGDLLHPYVDFSDEEPRVTWE
ncbi:hypothetical protein [Leucobacter tenebrionis]|uniref:hypothetical protein n=1 Tax=Leucobacter tenebrionis TaxID=2873270 RepID=UPI001CA7ABD6|nr:hypothetical protein [Leucobacter tenebrionis]QZY51911.1 hypothetical protein KVY00_15425 [Leucobacter tenebrionis]